MLTLKLNRIQIGSKQFKRMLLNGYPVLRKRGSKAVQFLKQMNGIR